VHWAFAFAFGLSAQDVLLAVVGAAGVGEAEIGGQGGMMPAEESSPRQNPGDDGACRRALHRIGAHSSSTGSSSGLILGTLTPYRSRGSESRRPHQRCRS